MMTRCLGTPQFALVDWRVQNDKVWNTAAPEFVASVQISQHRLQTVSPWIPFYTHRLDITGTSSRFYKFMDRSGDEYRLWVLLTNRDHFVKYKSGNPDIMRVQY